MNPEIKIYCFYFKNLTIPFNSEIYHPIIAGKALLKENSDIIGDDTEESLSKKNGYYSELTGIYWVWKNTFQDIVGTCHYRRYFTLQPEPIDLKIKRFFYFFAGLNKKRYGLIYTNDIKRFKKRVISREEIVKTLDQFDVILPQRRKLKYSVYEHYRRYHNIDDLKIVEKILKHSHPEYLPAYYKMLKGNRLYANNMFILSNKYFYPFMEWLFDILFQLEKEINLNEHVGYQQRVFGFIAERLLTLWFFHNKLKTKELQLIYFKNLKK